MPREGYKTLTIPTEIYDEIKQEWSKKRRNLYTLSGYLMYLIDEDKKRSCDKIIA